MEAPSHRRPKVNHLPRLLRQVQDYWFGGAQKLLARDAGLSRSTVSRIMRGETRPYYDEICKIVTVLEAKLGQKFDPRDLYDM
jgi:transcriptional regulator with XRE-family HTH domain